jgi:hypothetical protein
MAMLTMLPGALASVPVAAAAPAPMLRTDRPVTDVAASGRQVAVLVGCRRVVLLRVGGTGRRVLKPARALCGGTPRYRAGPLAFDGRAVSFRVEGGGAQLEGSIFTAPTFPPTRPFPIDRARELDGGSGTHLDGPRGGAGTSAYLLAGAASAELRGVGPHGHGTVATMQGEARLLDVRGRRFVLVVDDELRVLDRAGAMRTRVPAGDVLAAAVLGTRILLLHPDRIDRLEPNGSISRSLRLAALARPSSEFAATATVAAYTDGGTIRAVRLSDGRDVAVASVPAGRVAGSGLVGIAVGSAGLVYARNGGCRTVGDCHGEVHRISNAALARAFG